MKISIITVVYNNELTISDAIDSVKAQTYRDIEYIVIDGKSTDNTLDILNSRKTDIQTLVSESDNGIYDAMNKGVSIATGDVIGILNSDDFYADDKVIEEVAKEFSADPSLEILYGDLVYVNSGDKNKVVRKWNSHPYYNDFFERGHVPPHPALFVRSQVYKKAGLFDTTYKLAADYEFMFRIFKIHKLKSKYINRLTVKMRLGGASNQSFKNIVKCNIEVFRTWKKHRISAPITLFPVRIFRRLSQFV